MSAKDEMLAIVEGLEKDGYELAGVEIVGVDSTESGPKKLSIYIKTLVEFTFDKPVRDDLPAELMMPPDDLR